MPQRGYNKLKLKRKTKRKGKGKNEKKNEENERRGEREGKRNSEFSLRSTELEWLSHIGPRLKSEYSSRATRGHLNQEFSSKI